MGQAPRGLRRSRDAYLAAERLRVPGLHGLASFSFSATLLLDRHLSVKMSKDSTDNSEEPAGPSKTAFSLENILGADHENVEHPTVPSDSLHASAEGWDEETGQEHTAQGFCVECEGTPCSTTQRVRPMNTRCVVRPACPGLLRDVFRQLL